jgi:hypothetical protein
MMTYETPELTLVSLASEIVLGEEIGFGDNLVVPEQRFTAGFVAGLDE